MAAKRRTDPLGTEQTHYRGRDTSAGVSEIIGAVLLIMLVVAVVGLIAVYLFSQQTPSKVPNLKFMTGVDSTKTTLYLYHNGGDSMKSGEFSVLLDGKPAAYTISDGSTIWSLGKNLVIPITGVPSTIQLVYNTTSSGGSVVISQAAVNVVSSQNVTPDELPYLDCSAVRNWACADQIPPEIIVAQYIKNSSVQKINFMRAWQAVGVIDGSAGHHFNFTVSKPNSTIHITIPSNPNCDAGNFYPLTTGDKVGITFLSNPAKFTVFGMAPQIWELSAGDAYSIHTTLTFANGTVRTYSGSAICHAYITEYSDLDSTLDITTTTTGTVTSLIVNESHAIEGLDSRTIRLDNFKPISNGMFLITYGGTNTPVYVVGWADSISYNGVIQTGLGFS